MIDPPTGPSEGPSQHQIRRLSLKPVIDTLTNRSTIEVPAISTTGNGLYAREDFREEQTTSPHIVTKLEQGANGSLTPALSVVETQEKPRREVQAANHNAVWKPGTFGFDSDYDDTDGFEQRATFSMMVVDGIINKPGQPKRTMQSEVSGAAGAAGLVGLGNILGTVFKYIGTFLIQYGFGASVYGLYTLASSMVNLISSIFNLGLDDAMVRYVAIYRAKKKSKSLQGLILFCTAVAGITGFIGALLLLFFTQSLVGLNLTLHAKSLSGKNSIDQLAPVLQMMAPLIPLFCMQVVWVGGLRGFKAFKWRVLSANIVQPVLQIFLLLCLLFFIRKLGIYGIAIALLVSTMVSVVLNLFFLLRQVAPLATAGSKQYEMREWLGFASLNFLTTIIDTVLDSIDTILLAVFSIPLFQIGQYGAAIRYSAFIALPLLSLNNIFAPTIAELHSIGERQKLEAMFKVVTKWTITFSLPIFLTVTLFSPYLLGLSGSIFIPAWPLLIAFALGGLVNACTGSVGYMLLMTGYNKLSFLNSLVAVGVNLVMGIILTPRYGAMGTAISTGLAICILNLMRLLQVGLLLKMQPYRWDTLKPIGAGLISSLVVGVLLYMLSYAKWYVILGHAVLSAQLSLIPLFLASYIGLLVLFRGSPEDEIVMASLRKKFLRGKNKK